MEIWPILSSRGIIIHVDLFTGDTSLGCPPCSQVQAFTGAEIQGTGDWVLGNFTSGTILRVRVGRVMADPWDLSLTVSFMDAVSFLLKDFSGNYILTSKFVKWTLNNCLNVIKNVPHNVDWKSINPSIRVSYSDLINSSIFRFLLLLSHSSLFRLGFLVGFTGRCYFDQDGLMLK